MIVAVRARFGHRATMDVTGRSAGNAHGLGRLTTVLLDRVTAETPN